MGCQSQKWGYNTKVKVRDKKFSNVLLLKQFVLFGDTLMIVHTTKMGEGQIIYVWGGQQNLKKHITTLMI